MAAFGSGVWGVAAGEPMAAVRPQLSVPAVSVAARQRSFKPLHREEEAKLVQHLSVQSCGKPSFRSMAAHRLSWDLRRQPTF